MGFLAVLSLWFVVGAAGKGGGRCLDGDSTGDRVIWQQHSIVEPAIDWNNRDVLAISDLDVSSGPFIRFVDNSDFDFPVILTRVKAQGIRTMQWHPLDPNVIAVATSDGFILVMRVDGTIIANYSKRVGNPVWGLAWSPDGKFLAASFLDPLNCADVLDMTTMAVKFTISETFIFQLRWSPNGKYILTCAPSSNYLWDAQTGERLRALGRFIGDFNPTGDLVLVLMLNGNISIVNPETGAIVNSIKSPKANSVEALSWSRDPYIVSLGVRDMPVVLWDIRSIETVISPYTGPDTIHSIAWSVRDGMKMVTIHSGSFSNTVTVWDSSTGPLLRTMGGNLVEIKSCAFSEGIAARVITSMVELRDTESWQLLSTFRTDRCFSESIMFSNSGRYLAVQSCYGVWIYEIPKDLSTQQPHIVCQYNVTFGIKPVLAWDYLNLNLLAIGHSDGTDILDVSLCKPIQQIPGLTQALVWSSPVVEDGRVIGNFLAGGGDNWIRVWNTTNYQMIYNFTSSVGVTALAWSPDTKRLVVAEMDYVTVQDIRQGTVLFPLAMQFPYGTATKMAWDPSGWLCAVAAASTIFLCEPTLGTCLPALTGTAQIRAVWFSTSGLFYSMDVHSLTKVWARPPRVDSTSPNIAAITYPISVQSHGHGLMGVDMMVLRYQVSDSRKARICQYLKVATQNDTDVLFEPSANLGLRYYQILVHSKYRDPPWSVMSAVGFYPTCPRFSVAQFSSPYAGDCECLHNYYADPKMSDYCQSCPPHATCIRNSTINTITSTKNYWQSQINLTQFLRCPARACNEGGCVEGYEGPLCGRCSVNFGQSGFNVCKRCPNPVRNFLLLGLQALSAAFIVTLLTYFAVGTTPRQRKNPYFQLISIVLSAAQVNTMLLNVDVWLPGAVQQLVETQGAVQAAATAVYSFSCAAIYFGTAPQKILYMKLRLSALLPILVPCILYITMAIVAPLRWHCVRMRREYRSINNSNHNNNGDNYSNGTKTNDPETENDNDNDEEASSSSSSLPPKPPTLPAIRIPLTCGVITLFTLYPTLASLSFQTVSCREVDGQHYLSSDLSVPCYDAAHYSQLVLVGFVLIFYILLAPLLVVLVLRAGRQVNEQVTNLTGAPLLPSSRTASDLDMMSDRSSGISNLSTHVKLVARLSVKNPHQYVAHMKSGFRVEWWFIVVLARKLILAALSTFMWKTAPLQLVLISITLVLFLAFHTWHQPFRFRQSNLAESASLLTSTTLFAFSQLLSYPGIEELDIGGVGYVLIILPLLFLAFILFLILNHRFNPKPPVDTHIPPR